MNVATQTPKREIQWLRSQQYDMVLILGVLCLGIFSALMAVAQPALLWPIITINLWLFGYHHVRPMGYLYHLFLLAMVALFETKLGRIAGLPR
jgi:hypothetical protein